MATIQRYVNTASSGGDGTTNGTSGASAAYVSLSSWEANQSPTAADALIVDCCGTAADTVIVTVDFATAPASTLIQTNRFDSAGFYTGTSVISTSHYRLTPDLVDSFACLTIVDAANVTIDGLQFAPTRSGGLSSNARCIGNTSSSSSPTVIRNNRLLGTTNIVIGIGESGAQGSNATRTFQNNLLVNWDDSIFYSIATHFSPTLNIYHNTIYGDGSAGSTGINLTRGGGSSNPTLNVKGNVVANTVDNDIVITGTLGTVNKTDNATEDSTGEITSITPSSVWTNPGTTSTNVFTLKDTSSAAYNVVNPTLITDDITGFTRDGTNHDAGAFEFQSGGGGGGTAYSLDATSFSVAATFATADLSHSPGGFSYILNAQSWTVDSNFGEAARDWELSGAAATITAAFADATLTFARGPTAYTLVADPFVVTANVNITDVVHNLSGFTSTNRPKRPKRPKP